MPRKTFDPIGGLAVLGELVRLTAPPAGLGEICDQGLALTVKALSPSRALLLLNGDGDAPPAVAAAWGRRAADQLRAPGEKVMREGGVYEQVDDDKGAQRVIALPLPGDTGAAGAIVLECPATWNPEARIFARSAARTIAAALRASRAFREIQNQGELLARRNVELETLREFRIAVQDVEREEDLLQAGLDLLLKRLGLESGWIFMGEESRCELTLAAHRGIDEAFVRRARESGIGHCLCAEVFATGTPMVARNTLDCPRLPELVAQEAKTTHAAVPLKFERGVLGVLNIANRPNRLFSGDELKFLETFGNHICLAVDKARTARTERRRNAEGQALASLTRAIGGSLDRQRVLAAVGEYGRELLGADHCAILLGDDSGPPLFAYLSGPPIRDLEVGRPVDLERFGSRALLGVLRERRPMVIENTDADPRANPDLARHWGLKSVIVVPLLARQRLEGILFAARRSASTWTADQVDLAGTLAEYAAMAIENARLYREAQEALLRTQQAQVKMMQAERLATVGTLASSLAHEVRNPLNSINLQLTLLSRRAAKAETPLREGLGDLIETARREITRLDDLVNEFLTLSRIDRLSLEEADLVEVARDVASLMEPQARDQGLSVVENLPASMTPMLLDREKLKQVLINLVRNAIEAMPGGGTVTIEGSAGEESQELRVIDTGPGIDAGLDVFSFFTTTKPGGTGLGLPLSRGIVEAHGGTLTYDSGPGRGTTFTIRLPVPARETGSGRARGRR
jgi:signal transduction histidine kinase